MKKIRRVTDLSGDVLQYIIHIPHWKVTISSHVAVVLYKLSHEQQLSAEDEDLLISPQEVAAMWSLRSKRIVTTDYVKIKRQRGDIREEVSSGSGLDKHVLYRLGDVSGITVRNYSTTGREPRTDQLTMGESTCEEDDAA